MSTTISDLEKSPAFRRIADEAMARDEQARVAARQQAATDLAALDRWHDQERAHLNSEITRANKRVEAAKAELAAARAALGAVRAREAKHEGDFAGKREVALRVLRQTKDGAWGDFRRELDRIESETRAAARSRPLTATGFSRLFGRTLHESNSGAVAARLGAIVAARTEADRLAVEHVGDAAPEISRILASIPPASTLAEFRETAESATAGHWLRWLRTQG